MEALTSVGPTGGRKGTQNAANGERIIADSVKRNGMCCNRGFVFCGVIVSRKVIVLSGVK